ncbi:DUF3833 domain-containing protein [Psychrosphaera sp. F3M07]|uniref:DUF3833 domain-containing protein n=1 Tax=Psychrosphaera sp. F3M07 TaxID=2841560 RepID=UPI001C084722|nr:DUF3833 domain-containing protein [Psychrosphaera sp. F3M07]MBU2918518.1 DUF3833 domain-containing protein [Psychrosphaera sp. F3M07]
MTVLNIKKIGKTITYLLVSILLISCSTDISTYKNKAPTFDIKQYFNGEMIAWGMIQDYSSKVTRRFCVELAANWQQEQGTLAETFYFDDGEISYRTWNLTKQGAGKYSGTAEDVVGVASGQQSGFAFQWQYTLSVPIDDTVYQFEMDDWMYQIDQYRVFNRTSMSKLGIKVAEITLFFDKGQQQKQCQTPVS